MVEFDRGRVLQHIGGSRGRFLRFQLKDPGERGVSLENIVAVPADRSSGRQDIGQYATAMLPTVVAPASAERAEKTTADRYPMVISV